MNIIIRKAAESDRNTLATLIAECFDNDFIAVAKDNKLAAEVIKNSFDVNRFFVAQKNGDILGFLGWAYGDGERLMSVDRVVSQQVLGDKIGNDFYNLCRYELEKPLTLPHTTGYIELVGVTSAARGHGLAAILLTHFIKNSNFSDFMLEVRDDLDGARHVYETSGFTLHHREDIGHDLFLPGKQRLFMTYKK